MEDNRKARKITTVKNQVVFTFRLPYELYQGLEKKAVKNSRSINSQLLQAVMADLASENHAPPQANQS